MIRGLTLPKYKSISKNKRIGYYNKPSLVYIPLISGNDTDISVAVSKGDYVYKGSIIGKRKGNFKVPITSSVSGYVVDYVKKTVANNKKVKCVAIENDFKEKEEIKKIVNKKINKYNKEEFLETIKNCGVVGMYSGMPTYLKFDVDTKVNTLVVNCTEASSYVTSNYVLIKEKCEEILETIDAILEINDIDKAILAVNKSDTEILDVFNTFIGTYLKIKIKTVPNIYPIGLCKNIVSVTCGEKYDVSPIEKGIIVNDVSTIYAIYEALKYDKPLCERIITFTGDGIKKPQNVYVKVGTSIKEIVEKIGTYDNSKIIIGEPMRGKLLDEEDDVVATNDLSCVLILKKMPEFDNSKCIRCGKCIKYCPVNIAPVLINDNQNDKEKLKKYNPEKCIKCGLCSFICPAGIDLRNVIERVCDK